MNKGYRQLLTTVTAQLMTWIPVILVVFRVRADTNDVRTLAAYIAPFVAGVAWFVVQYQRAAQMATEEGTLPRPQWFWSLATGRITNHAIELTANRPLTVVSLAQDQPAVEDIVPQRLRTSSAIGFFTLDRAGSGARREVSPAKLTSELDAQFPVGLVVVDGGEWGEREEFDQAIRAWGARHPELPIVAVATREVSAPGGKPSLRFSAIPWETLSDPPLLGITNRLLQQAAIRGQMWRATAERFRWLALGGIGLAVILAGICAGLLALTRQAQARDARELAYASQYRAALVLPEAHQRALLQAAYEVRSGAPGAVPTYLNLAADALRGGLIRAQGANPRNTNVVFLGIHADGDSTRMAEIARAPNDATPRPPFAFQTAATQLTGIAPCVAATRTAVYWYGVAHTDAYRSSTLSGWSASGQQVARFDSADQSLKLLDHTCQYLRLPSNMADDDRTELLCSPVGALPNGRLSLVGVICVSSDETTPWLGNSWARAALRTATIWLANIDWEGQTLEKLRPQQPAPSTG
jgi:hypothetical protein